MIGPPLASPRHITRIQFLKYGAMGITNTLLDFVVYFLLTRLFTFFGTYIFLAKAISFFVATSWSFFGNKRWTFAQSQSTTLRQVSKFYITASLNGVINVSTHFIVVRLIGAPDTTGIVFAAAVTVVFGFILNKWWVFKTNSQEPI